MLCRDASVQEKQISQTRSSTLLQFHHELYRQMWMTWILMLSNELFLSKVSYTCWITEWCCEVQFWLCKVLCSYTKMSCFSQYKWKQREKSTKRNKIYNISKSRCQKTTTATVCLKFGKFAGNCNMQLMFKDLQCSTHSAEDPLLCPWTASSTSVVSPNFKQILDTVDCIQCQWNHWALKLKYRCILTRWKML